jgi:hypothetical protein
LVSPEDNVTVINKDVVFTYTVSDINILSSCAVYLDGILRKSNTSPSRIQPNDIDLTDIADGQHSWKISCMNILGRSNFSAVRTFNVLDFSDYSGNSTTNTSLIVNNTIIDLTLEKSGDGKIIFEGATNISQILNLAQHVKIYDKSIFVNSSAIPALNKPAVLEMSNVSFNNVLIWKDGAICDDCNTLSKEGEVLIFGVQGFSTYVVTSTSFLEIFDDTDSSTKLANESVTVYANYSDIILGTPLSGTCEITYDINGWTPWEEMNFNAGSNLYEYARSFEADGNYPYEVSCTTVTPGFDNLVTQDYVGISPVPTVTQNFLVINVSVQNSSSYTLEQTSTSDAQDYAQGSNVSQVSLDTSLLTDSWQGFYGKITPEILLRGENQTLFYKWNSSLSRGQIFASRSNEVNWNTINCTSANGVSVENDYLDKNINESDSVTKTFSVTNHPQFVVGAVLLKSCASTRTNEFGGDRSNVFWNVLLSDNNGEGNIVYTGFVNASSSSFNNEGTDFQLLVGENGKEGAATTTPYYFYLELD